MTTWTIAAAEARAGKIRLALAETSNLPDDVKALPRGESMLSPLLELLGYQRTDVDVPLVPDLLLELFSDYLQVTTALAEASGPSSKLSPLERHDKLLEQAEKASTPDQARVLIEIADRWVSTARGTAANRRENKKPDPVGHAVPSEPLPDADGFFDSAAEL